MRRHCTASSATATKNATAVPGGWGPNAITEPEWRGGGEGSRHNAKAICRRAGCQRRHCHSSLATTAIIKRDAPAIGAVSAAIKRDSSGNDKRVGGGGARGRPRRNASAARRVARRISTPPLPLLNGGKHTRSRRHQGNDERRGGGRRGTRATTRLTPPVDARAIDAV